MILLDDYKMKMSELNSDIEKIVEAANLDAANKELSEIEKTVAEPGFWDDGNNSKAVFARQSALKAKVGEIGALISCRDDAATLLELAEEMGADEMESEIVEEFDKLEKLTASSRISMLFSGDYDANNAILTFHAGAGGTEAQDWVAMLFRMYQKFAANHGFKVTTLDYLDGEEAGIKSASLLIEGHNAYGYLKSENGVHRLVRVSPFDASGRRHTSFASLEVMPEISDDIDVEIREEDIKVDTYRSSGAGGQHVNKTESAIRITHIPTGIVVNCQNERSQVQNRAVAMKMLKSKLLKIKEQENLERIEDIKGDQMQIAWGSQIRSYVFMPYTLAKDHRTGYEQGNINAVMDGDLDGFINAYLIMQTKNNAN